LLFHSLTYALLLAATLLVCGLLKPTSRWLVLLAASGLFYAAWRIEYLGLMLLTITSCHWGALGIERLRNGANAQRAWIPLLAVISINLAVLFLFKYLGLFVQSWNQVSGAGWQVDLGFLLPVGISFYTFQAIGYVIDVYRGVVPAEKSLARTALFIAFFPQLVAGPIERAGHLLPALRGAIVFRWKNFRCGLWLILWGLFKKLVIADRLALLVDNVYSDPNTASGGLLLLATYAFAFQIYCDFSGYSDMAIGSARLFGIELMQNFRLPYLARGLRDFWARWHISLSTWFRDYLYIPLGGNRAGQFYWFRNILLVFILSGFWHGAAWTYAIWGAIHGLAIVIEIVLGQQVWGRYRPASELPRADTQSFAVWRSVRQGLHIALTFHIVLLGWVFFRAASLDEAWLILHRMLTWTGTLTAGWPSDFSRLELAVSLVALSWMFLIETLSDGRVERWLGRRPRFKPQTVVAITLLLLINFGIFTAAAQFVYFQF
jgi:D-alanyl-lipoteichoic acid acyltransferase DltB (MBOAT superfamily)